MQEGILALLGTVIVGLLGWRGASKVKHDNAQEGRQSRFADNIQTRHDAALAQIDHLKLELGKIPMLERRLAERDRTIRNLLDSLDAEQQKNARRWAPESAFAPPHDFVDPKPRKD